MYQALLASARVGHIVEQFHSEDLPKEIPRDLPMTAYDPTAIGQHKGWFFTILLQIAVVEQMDQRGVKQIENQCPPVCEVAMHRRQAGELVFHSEQVLEWTKRHGDETKSLSQIKLPHIPLHQALDPGLHRSRLASEMRLTDCQHAWRGVEPCNLDAGLGRRDQHPPGATANLEHWARCTLRHRHKEGHILAMGIGDNVIIELRYERLGIVSTCRIRVTELTVQWRSQTAATPIRRNHPGPIAPRRIMTYVLLVSEFQVRDPVLDFILMIVDDLALHHGPNTSSLPLASRPGP